MKENSRSIEGYRFGNDKDAEQAASEARKIRFLEERIHYDDPQSVRAIYQRAIDNRIFQTPVGIEYLRKLQQFLKTQTLEKEIRDIPIFNPVTSQIIRSREERAMKDEIKRLQANGKSIRRRYRISLMLNICLMILVMAMFIITLYSDNPNIINYKRTLENKYSAWEQDLTEREQQIREREKEGNVQK